MNDLVKALIQIDEELEDLFLSDIERKELLNRKIQIINKLDSTKTLYPVKNNVDRQSVERIQKQIKTLTKELNSYTKHKSGKTYSSMLRSLIYEYIQYEGKSIGSVKQYRRYEQLRQSISKTMSIKTQMYTKSEYMNALYIIETNWNFKVPNKYKV